MKWWNMSDHTWGKHIHTFHTYLLTFVLSVCVIALCVTLFRYTVVADSCLCWRNMRLLLLSKFNGRQMSIYPRTGLQMKYDFCVSFPEVADTDAFRVRLQKWIANQDHDGRTMQHFGVYVDSVAIFYDDVHRRRISSCYCCFFGENWEEGVFWLLRHRDNVVWLVVVVILGLPSLYT